MQYQKLFCGYRQQCVGAAVSIGEFDLTGIVIDVKDRADLSAVEPLLRPIINQSY